MKVRTDYVTNSSSSSFILAFSDENSIVYELLNDFGTDNLDMLGIVIKDVFQADRLSKDEVLEKIRDYLLDDVWYIYLQKKRRENRSLTIDEFEKWMKTEEGRREVDEYIENIVNNISRNMDDKLVFVEVEYSDHDYNELEHEIMPNLGSTVYTFSCH